MVKNEAVSGWSYALAQHPMYLIIEEDEACAERTPPWGAPSIEEYIERWQRCLVTLERHGGLRFGFDTSGVELSRLAARRPGMVERMRGLVRQGRLAFYNGTAVLAGESIGALARLLVRRPVDPLDDIWKTILTAQHHDAYCFCAPRLKDKAIGWLDQAALEASTLVTAAARSIADAVDTSGLPGGSPLIVFNTNPAPTTDIVSLEMPPDFLRGGIEVLDASGQRLPSFVEGGRVCFQTGIRGLGYRSYVMRQADSIPEVRTVEDRLEIEGMGWSAVVEPDGTFLSLRVEDLELLQPDRPGNVLRACTPDGNELGRTAEGPTTLVSSPIAEVLRATCTLGPRMRARTEIWLYRALPRIDVRLFLTFDEAAIGDFFDDDSKLNVYWPLGFDGEIHHDIAFGAVKTRPGRPFFPVSWVDVSDGRRGFAYFTRGTQRHRMNGRTLANVFAWGDDTDRIGNRADSTPRPWPKRFDQRLRGSHLIEYALYPHEGRWDESGVVQAARSYGAPLLAALSTRHGGMLPSQLNALTVGPANVVVSSVLPSENGIRLRMYESAGRRTRPSFESDRLTLQGLAGLDGQPCDELGPFRIGHAALLSAGASPQ